MADWAGAYGAGGATDELRNMLRDRLLQAAQAEEMRRNRAIEAEAVARRQQQDEQFRSGQQLDLTQLAAQRDERYQDRTQHVDERNQALQRQTVEDQIRAKELADKSIDETTRTKDEQAFRTSERKGRESFESLMARRAGSGAAASEPLVAIKDPTTGQPTLVPRSQAAGRAPASTRDQALTEGQSNAAGFADRMKFNEDYIKGFETSATSRTTQASGWLPTEMQSDAQQQYSSAKGNWIAANLRKESGAAISASEYETADRQYFPQPGEGAAVIAQKRKLRAVAEASMRRAAGHAVGATQTPDVPAGNDLGAEW